MAPATAQRYGRVFASFARYAQARGLTNLGLIDSSLCNDFVQAPLPRHGVPSQSTARFRLTVVRDAMLGLRALGLLHSDPTHALRVAQAPTAPQPVPLTPLEVRRIRAVGRLTPRDTLRPTAVELALSGASHAEIARAVVADVDLPGRSLQLGTQSCHARTCEIDELGATVLGSRVDAQRRRSRRKHLPWDPFTTPLALTRPLHAYRAESIAPTVSSSLSRAMSGAGLDREGLRPRSLREFAANRAYALTQRAEHVAHILGVTSLDAAMGFIDSGWQLTWGHEVRANERRR
jgi:integrase